MNKLCQRFLVESVEFGSTEITINTNDLAGVVSQHINTFLLEQCGVTNQSMLKPSEKVPLKVIILKNFILDKLKRLKYPKQITFKTQKH